MSEIRPVTHDDLPEVVKLLTDRMPGWWGSEETLAGTMLDHPWAEEEMTPLVSIGAEDKITGFIGVQVRRLLFDARPIKGVVATQLAVTEDAGPAGALLIKRVLSGRQELTWSDGTTEGVVRIWRAFGGAADYVRACDFLLVLRPVRWIRGTVSAAMRRSLSREELPVGGFPFQAAGPRIAGRAFPEPDPEVNGSDAEIATVTKLLPELGSGLSLRVDHDQAYLEHMFSLVAKFAEPMVCRVVRRGDKPIGWYAYRHGRRRVSHVMHLLATEGESEAVLSELLDYARANGSSVVAGRAEPHLMEPLARRFAILGYSREPVLHSKDPDLVQALNTERALLTRLDGEVFLT